MTRSQEPAGNSQKKIDQAVARIINYRQRPNWFSPWDMLPVEQTSGTGFVVEGGLVMTNAHVVSDARLLLLFLHGDPNPHEAIVHAIGHDCDLALLRPLEPGILDDRTPLPFAGLPRLRSSVETFGYPAGGRQISSTRGVVSRIEVQYYSHPANERHLTIQTDAAINPGNSGGPVIQDGHVVGVAFQAASELQNVGYIIPTEVIHHFLTDAANPPYRGFPTLGARLQNLENRAARQFGGMQPDDSGAVVDLVFPESSAVGVLQQGDIVLEIEGQSVANDGSIALPPFDRTLQPGEDDDALRVDLTVLIDRHQVGETLSLKVLREGERFDLELPLFGWPPSHRYANQHDLRPRYYVYGGLVFVPLDLEMLKTFGAEWRSNADKALLHEFLQRPYHEPDQWSKERVVLLRRLDHPLNSSMNSYQNIAVEKINGRAISNLTDLVDAFETNQDRFHVIDFSNNRIGVLDRVEADQHNQEILERYGVTRDRNL